MHADEWWQRVRERWGEGCCTLTRVVATVKFMYIKTAQAKEHPATAALCNSNLEYVFLFPSTKGMDFLCMNLFSSPNELLACTSLKFALLNTETF